MQTLRACTVCVLMPLLVSIAGCSDTEPIQVAPIETPATPATVLPPAPDDARCRLATADTMNATDCPNPGDGDHDGVDDGTDLCPDTTPGIEVDASGCALAVKATDPGTS